MVLVLPTRSNILNATEVLQKDIFVFFPIRFGALAEQGSCMVGICTSKYHLVCHTGAIQLYSKFVKSKVHHASAPR